MVGVRGVGRRDGGKDQLLKNRICSQCFSPVNTGTPHFKELTYPEKQTRIHTCYCNIIFGKHVGAFNRAGA